MTAVPALRCGDTRLFLTDVSSTNGPIDGAKLSALHDFIAGVAVRASISWGFTDPVLDHNREVCTDFEFPWMAYHVPYPGQPVSAQTNRMFRAVDDPGPWKRRILDIELAGDGRGAPPAPAGRWADVAWRLSEACLAHDGKRPIIYSRTNLVNAWLVPYWTREQLNAHYWWLAQYRYRIQAIALWTAGMNGEYLGAVPLPRGVDSNRFLIHQTGNTCPAFSQVAPPLGSARQDTDRWVHPAWTPATFGEAE